MRVQNYDVLKAIAIVAVVLYHFGISEYGYLGVDIFLVIAGYFTSKSIDNQIVNGGGYLRFVANRIFRLWPLLLIAGAVCLNIGWLMMLPDDFENTANSIVATNFFANNILESITTKNYWDVNNEYKPLMHTWYVGLLMQFYVLIPFILFIIGRLIKDAKKRQTSNLITMVLIAIVSVLLYWFSDNACARFYYLPYRLFEFCIGGIVFYLFGASQVKANKKAVMNVLFSVAYLCLITLIFVESDIISSKVKLFAVVLLSALLLVMMPRTEIAQGKIFANKWLAAIGAASFSIFVWHQVVLAMIRYSFTNNLTEATPLLAFVALTAILSVLSYKYVEKMKETKGSWVFIALLFVLTTAGSLYIYANAGVVRDVPELEVVKGNVHRGMWAEYCDRGYKYDKEFTDDERPKWYVIGNSFGRDMVNIILESPYAELVDVVYSDPHSYSEKNERFKKADIVFLSTLGLNEALIEEVQMLCKGKTKLFLIGEKNFGENNGQVYRHRFAKDYHQLTIDMEDGYAEKNERLKAAYPDIYIDMIDMVLQPDGKVRVFSDDGRFISQDCRHLTKAGAQYYASLFKWERFYK